MFNSLTATSCPSTLNPEPASDRKTRSAFAVETSGLTVVRGRSEVLGDVDLAVSPGEIVALQGANGAGKSTLLHCLAGALQPTRGRVLWFGEPAARSPAARRGVGFLGHESGLYLSLTAQENLLFAGRMVGVNHPAERADQMLTAAGLDPHMRKQAGQLSRGQRQRLAIARAVIHEPAILLLDEPFTGLDLAGCQWLQGLLRQFRETGCAMLIASHDLEEDLTDRFVVLHRGRLCSTGQAA